MCSGNRVCTGAETGMCDYFGFRMPYNLIQLVGEPQDKESARQMFEDYNGINNAISVFCEENSD